MTRLLYLEDFDVTSCEAYVQRVETFEGRDVVVLDQTCFYPKGGGQDFDIGIIKGDAGTFDVEAVFFIDGEVKHIGAFESKPFQSGDQVSGYVAKERRKLNSRLHSAGHTIDMAVRKMNLHWHPEKGAHYPYMAFVEYSGEIPEAQRDHLKDMLEDTVNQLVKKGSLNSIAFLTPEEMAERGAVLPQEIPANKPARAVIYDDFVVPCGGTHVDNINQIGDISITKLKKKDGHIRVSYVVV